MADKKSAVMVLKVDLHCSTCKKKIKKILSKFPQIRDQIFDEKANTVTIDVLCCNPEKLRDKLCCKGKNVIKSIEILDPPKPKEPEKPPEEPKEPEKPEEPEESKEPENPVVIVVEEPKEPEEPTVVVIEEPKEPENPTVVIVEQPKETEEPTVVIVEQPEKPVEEPPEEPKEDPKPDPPTEPEPAPDPPACEPFVPISIYPNPNSIPWGTCCSECYHGFNGGPCYNGYGAPPPPQWGSDGYEYGYSQGRPFRSRCDQFFSDDNPQGCSIM